MNSEKNIVTKLLHEVDVHINGSRPWDIQVHDKRFYKRVLKGGSLGLGESYMEGWWDCRRVDELICRLLKGNLQERVRGDIRMLFLNIVSRLFNRQSLSRSGIIARKHYNLGNDLFFSFLDPHKQYSCAYFNETDDLAEAQLKKLDLICRKIDLQPGDNVLDIGCGWGGFARYAAENYGCTVTGINISDEQIRYAREYCRDLPVEILKEDYRKIRGSFDKIVSVGMFEHVGNKNYRTFMEIAKRCLKDEGIFLLHTIGSNASRTNSDPWIDRYIFPNGMLPSLSHIGRSAEDLFVIEDIHNLGPHYDKTLLSWHAAFQKAWPTIENQYTTMFKRMWDFYLLSCAGAFCARDIQVWQIVMTKPGAVQPPCRFGYTIDHGHPHGILQEKMNSRTCGAILQN